MDFPPLLGVGFHPMTLAQVRDLCVTRFPLSTTRGGIMGSLELVVGRLIRDRVDGALWVDGSFLTEKINPKDVDVLLHVSADFYNAAAIEVVDAMGWVGSNLKIALRVDSYLWVEHRPTGAADWEPEWQRAYWIRQFGYSREDEAKGMALIRLAPSGGP